MRKLASIQKIKNIEPIEGADRIEKATVLGWNVVVKKDEFKIGDWAIYFEIDSLLPDEPKYEFLKKSSWNPRYNKIRLKTVKMKGVVSQGLLLPLSSFPDINFSLYNEGSDLTEILGIEKYEPIIPASLGGDVNAFTWPISKTDEERCIHEDTLIDTPQGKFSIKYICTSDINEVYSYNVLQDEIEIKQIENKIITKKEKIWKKIFFDDGTFLICTEDHKIFLPEENIYREARYLHKNEIVLSM